VTRRIIELNLDRHDLYGIDWAWLSFGSEGRDEQTFTTDQDNGIVFICTDIMDRELTQLRFLEFARDVNADLDRCGFPLCKGNIMASNPDLCLTLEEWEERFARWVRTPEPQALLNATIFFDFRPLYGRFNLAHRLRLSLFRQTRGNPLFLRMLAENALSVVAAARTDPRLRDRRRPRASGTIDLKKYGVRLFTDAARVFALANSVEATNTVQRLKRAGAVMNIARPTTGGEHRGLQLHPAPALRHQHFEQEQGRAGRQPDPAGRTERDRAAHPEGGFPPGTQAAGAPQTRLPALSMTWFSRAFSGPGRTAAAALTAGSSSCSPTGGNCPPPTCGARTIAAATWWSTSRRAPANVTQRSSACDCRAGGGRWPDRLPGCLATAAGGR
jgi:signal-transduction protein with cAMP-binding, CBS, and nucleotidyltransferase domain